MKRAFILFWDIGALFKLQVHFVLFYLVELSE